MILTGGCYCGAVRYRADGEPFHETICHCADCRRIAGSPHVAWFSVNALALTWEQGEPVRYASNALVERTHCGTCGTCLTYQSEAEEIDVTIASLDDPGAVPPRDHTLVADRLSWDSSADELPIRRVSRD